MKSFITALFGLIAQAALRFWDRIRSGQSRQLAAETFGGIKSLFASEDDSGAARKRLVFFVAGAGILLVIICVCVFVHRRPEAPAGKELVAPMIRDANKDIWTLQLVKGQSRRITDGRKPGPPLIIKTDAQFQGGLITIGVHLEGQAGEKYVPGVLKNGVWQPAPKFQIVDENGQILTEGQFEYG